MTLQKLLSRVRKACDMYDMINHGDKIAVGVSGGKDSLALLAALSSLRRFYPKHFELCAITVSLGFNDFDTTPVQTLCDELNVPYTVVKTEIGAIVFDIRREPNPCALCSKMRKGALNTEAKRQGCNKIALGHNKEDVVESFLMSLFYEGRIHTFSPVTNWDRMALYAIRPLMLVDEADAAGFCRQAGIQVIKSPCPADGHTKRQVMKDFVKAQSGTFPNLGDKLFSAIMGSNIKGYSELT